MEQLAKGTIKTCFLLGMVLLGMHVQPIAQSPDSAPRELAAHAVFQRDTVPLLPIKLPNRNRQSDVKNQTSDSSSRAEVKPIDTIIWRNSSSSLDAPLYYEAKDSLVYDVPEQRIRLYGKENLVRYDDNQLTAPLIEFDQRSNQVSAYLVRDSSGTVLRYPTYQQSDFKAISDSIRFDMKTGKGMTKGTYTQQGEMFVYGERIKKINDSVFYGKNGRFTTCNLDTPHFAFVSSKVKFINKKMAFTGPVHPEIEGIPLPTILPFGIYPLSQGRHSGFIAPSFTANDQLGLALEGIGYYKILSDHWDVVARGTIYSYGGWSFNMTPRYMKRYRYQGNFGLAFQRFKTGFKGDPDFSSSNTFNIRWTHSADMKARPGVTFTASVNAGSSKFNSLVPNNPNQNFNNTLNSSISYGRVWKDKPFNLQVSANHDQNTNLNQINLRFPDLAFNVNTQYPFRRKESVGKIKWYENIGIALNTTARSSSFFYDTLANVSGQLMDNLAWGASHSVPITLSLPSLGPLQVSPSVSYQEKWYQEKLTLAWNPITQEIDTTIKNGFYTAREMSYGVAMTSRIFGMIGFGKNSKVQAIRHEIRPSISVNYKPNFNAANFYRIQVDTFGRTQEFNYYSRAVYGSFSNQQFGGMSFGIDNIIQMKMRNKKDTGEAALKKITLIDGWSFNSNYNMLADSFKLGGISMSARTNLFNKFNVTANANFDPYLTNASGQRIEQLIWTKKPLSLGTLQNANISLGGRFNGGDQTKQPTGNRTPMANPQRPNANLDEFQQEAAYVQNNPGEFADFNIPWSIDFSYSLRLNRTRVPNKPGEFQKNINQDFTFNGDLNLTPKWKIGMSGSYNITRKELGMLSMNFSRDLHCWQMFIAVSPVGRYKFFTLNISPKSNMLRDLKVNRTRYFYDL
jgi:hypothetical protein